MYLFEETITAGPLAKIDGRAPLTEPRFAAPAAPFFTPEEQRVLSIASRDGLRSIAEAGRFGKAFDRFFAIRRPLPLASPRLEILRRVAILLRMRRPLPVTELDQWHALGFSDQQLELIGVLVAPSRNPGAR
jgi:hypothetical protein